MPLTLDFAIILEPQPEGGFTVRVPALPKVVTEGNTESEALATVEEAIRLVIDHRRDHSIDIPPILRPGLRKISIA